jgi:hypothetical protein
MIALSQSVIVLGAFVAGVMTSSAGLYFMSRRWHRTWKQMLRAWLQRHQHRYRQAEFRAEAAKRALRKTRDELIAAQAAWRMLLTVYCEFLELYECLRKEALDEAMSNIENQEWRKQLYEEGLALFPIAYESLGRSAALRNEIARKEALQALEMVLRALERLFGEVSSSPGRRAH